MLSSARVVAKPPNWVDSTQGAAAYLLLGDACFPLFARGGELLASTYLTPKDFGPVLREERTRATGRRRAGKAAARRTQQHHEARRPPRPVVGAGAPVILTAGVRPRGSATSA